MLTNEVYVLLFAEWFVSGPSELKLWTPVRINYSWSATRAPCEHEVSHAKVETDCCFAGERRAI